MSEAEVKDNERKQVIRNMEKMTKVIESLKEEQTSYQNLIVSSLSYLKLLDLIFLSQKSLQDELTTAKDAVSRQMNTCMDLERKLSSAQVKASEQASFAEAVRHISPLIQRCPLLRNAVPR